MSYSGDIQSVLRKPPLRCRWFGHYWRGVLPYLTCTRCGKEYTPAEDTEVPQFRLFGLTWYR